MTKTITAIEKEWQHNCGIVKDFIKSFIFVGEALRKIRDEKLYQDHYTTFEEACKSEFGYAKSHAYRLIESSIAVSCLSVQDIKTSPNGGHVKSNVMAVLPDNERQARALSTCTDDADQMKKVWKEVVAEAGNKPITAAAIKRKADEILPPKIERVEEPKLDKRTEFKPDEFDPACTDTERPTNVPKHLVTVIAQMTDGKKLVSDITQLKKRIKQFSATLAGSWVEIQDVERKCDELHGALKFSLFAANCPRCKNDVKVTCDRCGGRGWLDSRHERRITDEERAWIEANK